MFVTSLEGEYNNGMTNIDAVKKEIRCIVKEAFFLEERKAS